MDSINDFLDKLDLDAVALPEDKFEECQYFYDLLCSEPDRDKFRWLLSAFLGACYSFLELKASYLYHRFNNPETGEPIKDLDAIKILEQYVKTKQNKNNPEYINVKALDGLIKKLYGFRNSNTHSYSLSIMKEKEPLPKGFHIGSMRGQGVPALDFCSEILALFSKINTELDET